MAFRRSSGESLAIHPRKRKTAWEREKESTVEIICFPANDPRASTFICQEMLFGGGKDDSLTIRSIPSAPQEIFFGISTMVIALESTPIKKQVHGTLEIAEKFARAINRVQFWKYKEERVPPRSTVAQKTHCRSPGPPIENRCRRNARR